MKIETRMPMDIQPFTMHMTITQKMRNGYLQVGTYSYVNRYAKLDQDVIIGMFCNIGPDVFIGRGTIVGDYVKFLPGTVIGQHCMIEDYVNTSGPVTIGDDVVIKRCSMIGRGCEIGDRVWIGSHVTTTRLRYPKLRAPNNQAEDEEQVVVEHDAIVGSAALLLAGARIGHHAMVGAGAIVGGVCEPYGIYRNQKAVFVRHRSDLTGKEDTSNGERESGSA